MLQPTWTPEIYDLMETLTCRVRVLSLPHIRRAWSERSDYSQTVIETIERLIRADLLQGDVWQIPPSPVSELPLCQWSVGNVPPDFGHIEQIVRNRWCDPPIPTPVVAATHKAARLFGSSNGGLPPDNHRNHDLLLAEVYLRYRTSSPSNANRWVGEDAMLIAERGVKNPDAYLLNERKQITRVIESAGRYSIQQLKSFHHHCETEQLAYELW